MSEILIEMKNIQKRFPGVHALDDVQLDLKKGEVLGLIGENGAGKSTLMKILAGIYDKDSGSVKVKDKEVNIPTPRAALDLGISMIHQELNLMNHLTIADNIYIGREFTKGIALNKKKQVAETKKLLDSMSLDLQPNTLVQNISVAKQQMVEIAKALSVQSDVLILDEPSAALTTKEIKELFGFIRELKSKGVGMIYISHRMEELMEITDRVTVMRDGKYVNTVKTSDTSIDEIIGMMVGRTIYEEPKAHSTVAADAPVVLEAKGLHSPLIKNASFQLRKGEILGFAGLMGAGRTETARLIFGADPLISGEIFINGEKTIIKTPQDAVRSGIGYLSEDRKRYGLAIGMSVADNCVLADIDNFSSKGVLNKAKIKSIATEYVEKINIKTPSIEQLVKNLSGGNQQKVVIAKWLIKNCEILIFDEPTRGIDVGAKSEIYKLINHLAQEEGKAIIMISSEMPELLRMSDRIICMCEGKITGEIEIGEATQENIMKLATTREQ